MLPNLINGKLPFYSTIGCYPLYYLDGYANCLCAGCADYALNNQEFESLKPVQYEFNWEDPNLYCDCCNDRIESAYAEEEFENVH